MRRRCVEAPSWSSIRVRKASNGNRTDRPGHRSPASGPRAHDLEDVHVAGLGQFAVDDHRGGVARRFVGNIVGFSFTNSGRSPASKGCGLDRPRAVWARDVLASHRSIRSNLKRHASRALRFRPSISRRPQFPVVLQRERGTRDGKRSHDRAISVVPPPDSAHRTLERRIPRPPEPQIRRRIQSMNILTAGQLLSAGSRITSVGSGESPADSPAHQWDPFSGMRAEPEGVCLRARANHSQKPPPGGTKAGALPPAPGAQEDR